MDKLFVTATEPMRQLYHRLGDCFVRDEFRAFVHENGDWNDLLRLKLPNDHECVLAIFKNGIKLEIRADKVERINFFEGEELECTFTNPHPDILEDSRCREIMEQLEGAVALPWNSTRMVVSGRD